MLNITKKYFFLGC